MGREEHANFFRESSSNPLKEMSIGDVLLATGPKLLVDRVIGKVEHEAPGFETTADGFLDESSRFHHFIGTQAIEMGESYLAYQLYDGIIELEARGPDMLQVREYLLAVLVILCGEVIHGTD